MLSSNMPCYDSDFRSERDKEINSHPRSLHCSAVLRRNMAGCTVGNSLGTYPLEFQVLYQQLHSAHINTQQFEPSSTDY
jgi:hypothetical protein